MTREETKEAIRIMQAYVDGKEIGQLNSCGEYVSIPTPRWNWANEPIKYRIKLEPHYRPFESEEEVIKAIRVHGDWVKYDGGYYRITYFSHDSVQVSDCDVESFMKAFKELTWADGTPFGVKED